jgi:hypothetical protein
MNGRDKASQGKSRWTERRDDVGEVAHDHLPDEVGKSAVKPVKGVMNRLERSDNLRQSRLVGMCF